MRSEWKQTVRVGAWCAMIAAAYYFSKGFVPLVVLYVLASFAAITVVWAAFATFQALRNERTVLACLSSLGGRATIAEFYAALSSDTTSYRRTQQLRETLVYLTERGRIAEADNYLTLVK